MGGGGGGGGGWRRVVCLFVFYFFLSFYFAIHACISPMNSPIISTGIAHYMYQGMSHINGLNISL